MDFKQVVGEAIAKALMAAWPAQDTRQAVQPGMLEIPPQPALGDFAFPCFRLSKQLKMGPAQIAQQLCAHFDCPAVARVECVGGYLNFFLNRENFARRTLEDVLRAPGVYGAGDDGLGRTVCLDYSSVNIAKRFHIGHLSTTVLGNSLKRIHDFLGYRTVAINHLGDWGTQFGKLISAYKRWGSEQMLAQEGINALGELYVRFHKEAQANPQLEDEGRAWFKKIESGDPEALAIFEYFKQITMADVEKIYAVLDVHFDSYAGESFYNDKMDRVVTELRQKGLLVQSDGAWVVNLEAWGMPPCLILKSDGATLYATRDIAAALYRMDTYHFDKCLYVVAYHQDLHFRQVFKVLELMGYEWARDKLIHVSYGMVSYEGQPMSTREGNVVLLEDLLAKAQEKALRIIEEKSPDLDNKQAVARDVGVGAVVFSAQYNNRIKDIDFWWERALNFEGETGPYVQYTHARCCSLLRRAPQTDAVPDYAALADGEAQALLKLIAQFPESVREAAQRCEPYLVTRAATDIAKAYNKYYYEHRILGGEPAQQAARLQLTDAVRQVVKTGLELIGLRAPEKM